MVLAWNSAFVVSRTVTNIKFRDDSLIWTEMRWRFEQLMDKQIRQNICTCDQGTYNPKYSYYYRFGGLGLCGRCAVFGSCSNIRQKTCPQFIWLFRLECIISVGITLRLCFLLFISTLRLVVNAEHSLFLFSEENSKIRSILQWKSRAGYMHRAGFMHVCPKRI